MHHNIENRIYVKIKNKGIRKIIYECTYCTEDPVNITITLQDKYNYLLRKYKLNGDEVTQSTKETVAYDNGLHYSRYRI
jgi:hypothetical protein